MKNNLKQKNKVIEVNNNKEVSEKNEETFYFYAASVGRRILSFLGDIFITFILSVFVFEIIAWPITRSCIEYEKKLDLINELNHSRIDLMYADEFLFYEDEKTMYNPEANIDYTGLMFTKFYVLKDISPDLVKYKDPIIHYYEEVCTSKNYDRNTIVSFYYDSNYESQYFEKYSGSAANFPVLKQNWVERWAPFFDENETVSDEVKTEINNFQLSVFRVNYLGIIEDFAKTNVEYISFTNFINSIYDEFDMYYQILTFASFIFVFVGLYVVFPMVNKKGLTLGKLILKLEVVNRKTFNYLSKKERVTTIFMTLLEQLPIILFIPVISVGFETLFSLSSMLIFTIISAVYCMASLIVTFLNSFKLSIKELLTNSVVCDRELIDRYYREVVYAEKRTKIEQ